MGGERLQSLRNLADGAQRALHDLDDDTRTQREEDLERLEAVLAYLSLVLERTDPLLVSPAVHAELTRLLEAVGAALPQSQRTRTVSLTS